MNITNSDSAAAITVSKLLRLFRITKEIKINLVKLKATSNLTRPHLNSATLGQSRKTKTTYQCNHCYKIFKDNHSLSIHERIHSGVKPFKCDSCPYSASSVSGLHSHVKNIHTKETAFSCQFCSRKFNTTNKLRRHEQVCRSNPSKSDPSWIEKQKRFKCNVCEYSAYEAYKLKNHYRIHTQEKPFLCSLCNYTSSSNQQLQNHIRSQHTGEKPYTCTECNYKAAVPQNLKNHVRVRHSKEIRTRNFPCQLCHKMFYSRDDANHHIKRHIGEKTHSCQYCSMRFVAGAQKNHHEIVCKKNPKRNDAEWVERQRRFKCKLCPFATAHSVVLNVHMEIHSKDRPKPYLCEFCNYRGYTWDLVNQHMRTHTGEKPFSCPHCEYKSGYSSRIQAHANSMHAVEGQEKNYVCQECPKAFMTKVNLSRHIQRHTNKNA